MTESSSEKDWWTSAPYDVQVAYQDPTMPKRAKPLELPGDLAKVAAQSPELRLRPDVIGQLTEVIRDLSEDNRSLREENEALRQQCQDLLGSYERAIKLVARLSGLSQDLVGSISDTEVESAKQAARAAMSRLQSVEEPHEP